MRALDLRSTPPRPPRATLAGLLMLPRTVDKARGQIRGGHAGLHYIAPGLSEWLLRKLRFSTTEFIALVERASDEAEIETIVLRRCSSNRVAHLNGFVESFVVTDIPAGLRDRFFSEHGDAPPTALVIDVLEQDDLASFCPSQLT